MRLVSNEAGALEALVRHHQGSVRGYLTFLGCPLDWRDDLVQDTFLALLGARFELRADAATAGYLRKVARHLFLKRRERAGPVLALDEHEPIDEAWTAFAAEDGGDGTAEALRECLERLDGRPAEVVRRHYAAGEPLATIGSELGLEVASVKSVLLRTRARLRECIERRRAR
jgi:RNA polymerase sigma-70 factor (ECF subfamily)